jgi:hypothetical protein
MGEKRQTQAAQYRTEWQRKCGVLQACLADCRRAAHSITLCAHASNKMCVSLRRVFNCELEPAYPMTMLLDTRAYTQCTHCGRAARVGASGTSDCHCHSVDTALVHYSFM